VSAAIGRAGAETLRNYLIVVEAAKGGTSKGKPLANKVENSAAVSNSVVNLQVVPLEADVAASGVLGANVLPEDGAKSSDLEGLRIQRKFQRPANQHHLEFHVATVEDEASADVARELVHPHTFLEQFGAHRAIRPVPRVEALASAIDASALVGANLSVRCWTFGLSALLEVGEFIVGKTPCIVGIEGNFWQSRSGTSRLSRNALLARIGGVIPHDYAHVAGNGQSLVEAVKSTDSRGSGKVQLLVEYLCVSDLEVYDHAAIGPFGELDARVWDIEGDSANGLREIDTLPPNVISHRPLHHLIAQYPR